MRNRIAVFQYDFPVQSYTKNLITALTEAGYHVDLFTTYYATRRNLVNIDELKTKNAKIYQGNSILGNKNVFSKIMNIISKKEVDSKFVTNALKIITQNLSEYLCFIGIEKQGLICAGKVSEKIHIPFIYYSLELYIEDHPSYQLIKKYRKAEILYHQKAKATIIQDKRRAEVLLDYNKISHTDLIIIPISVKGGIIRDKELYFHDKYSISSNSKIALYFGWIHDERYCSSLAEISEKLGNNYLIFHGYGKEDYLNILKNHKNVIVSTDLVDEKGKTDIISSAHVGIALYNSKFSNDRLTAFSSEKIALYLQSGLPIISYNNESYEELFSKFKCGEMIRTIDDFPMAFQKISENYELYREECFKAFNKYYCFNENIKPLIKYLDYLKN